METARGFRNFRKVIYILRFNAIEQLMESYIQLIPFVEHYKRGKTSFT